jgi:hypothetical protein
MQRKEQWKVTALFYFCFSAVILFEISHFDPAMKRNQICCLLLLVLTTLEPVIAQKLITCRLVDKETKKPIKNAAIAKVGTAFTTTTNALGFFQVEAGEKLKLNIIAERYIPATVEVSGKENAIIELEPRMYILGAPVVTGPIFPGGVPAFHEYIRKNLNVSFRPPTGTVIVSMLIDSTGAVIKDSVTITQSLCKPCDREALRIMKKSPNWIPGEQKSNIRVYVPIAFRGF